MEYRQGSGLRLRKSSLWKPHRKIIKKFIVGPKYDALYKISFLGIPEVAEKQ